ncbi:MAG: 2Fe-2S iron-sulfur cluster-binding protein [Schleiferiaceae bacterium]|jgi:ferredoxin|nr:2Fe-2S iron-sulfur cluster-binding protein [Schleiferiaceae bacterium]MDP4758301.1 2Fe-2S iron-sulfur cluster-binding protein [Schleiferiaceae bacterium]MDP4767236.1 2Fe-2S iron-sulfur cluster-binding protein [Schleiferiaceae bacterium]MDP4877252.1 2Fe-2S iron-sulfur cluster-binding protein [Schleiferiaceae bacterium]MDP4959675.1 2Fe-2S iron-sulfur cluster-binding protein [Schleiferiaceae bacterium]
MSADIKITVVDREGVPHELIAPTDMNMNLMEVCKSYELAVKGTCGGMAMCASCHCYIESAHELNAPSDDEEDMLDQAFFVEDNSRLGCQIFMKPEYDGLMVRLAEESE